MNLLLPVPRPIHLAPDPQSLEEQTQKLERDREDELEADSALDADRASDSPAAAVPVRESSNDIARWEPGSGTVKVEDKQTGTQQHSPIDIHRRDRNPERQRWSEGHAGD